MQLAQTATNIEARQNHGLDAELKFCRSALAHGNSLAMQGQLASATRDVWLIADAADAVKSFLARMEDIECLDRLNTQLAEVERGLNDLRRYLDIPPDAN
jgi:hypothetical protein